MIVKKISILIFSVQPSSSKEHKTKKLGGVDKWYMLISLYRSKLKTKKWYKRIIFHLIDLAIVNDWTLHLPSKDSKLTLCTLKKRHCQRTDAKPKENTQNNVPHVPLTSLSAKKKILLEVYSYNSQMFKASKSLL